MGRGRRAPLQRDVYAKETQEAELRIAAALKAQAELDQAFAESRASRARERSGEAAHGEAAENAEAAPVIRAG